MTWDKGQEWASEYPPWVVSILGLLNLFIKVVPRQIEDCCPVCVTPSPQGTGAVELEVSVNSSHVPGAWELEHLSISNSVRAEADWQQRVQVLILWQMTSTLGQWEWTFTVEPSFLSLNLLYKTFIWCISWLVYWKTQILYNLCHFWSSTLIMESHLMPYGKKMIFP